ncbi:nose resistant to fluoxetine protein 6, partial [Nephila pilipes]
MSLVLDCYIMEDRMDSSKDPRSSMRLWSYKIHYDYFRQTEYFDLVYEKPYARLSSYLVGIALGRYFYRTRVSKERINKTILFRGWMIASFLMYISFFALYKREESLIETALYNGSKDFLFSCSMAWILFVCLVGEG